MGIERKIMDLTLKPFMIKAVLKMGNNFKEELVPRFPASKILAHCCDANIAYHQQAKDTRMIQFWRALRNTSIQYYENDSYYARDLETIFAVLAKHPEIFTAFKDIPILQRQDIVIPEGYYYG